MNINFLETIWLWSNLFNSLKGSVFSITHYSRLWLWIYIIIIVWLYALLRYTQKTFTTMNTWFRVSIDTLYYNISLLLYQNKDTIYNFKENIPLLLQYKTQLINKKDKAYYYEDCERLITEIEYIYTLTNSNQAVENKDTLIQQSHILLQLTGTIKNIKTTLTIMTLWLYKLLW